MYLIQGELAEKYILGKTVRECVDYIASTHHKDDIVCDMYLDKNKGGLLVIKRLENGRLAREFIYRIINCEVLNGKGDECNDY